MQESLVVIVRAFITFFVILIYARLIGKQQIGNFTMFDYINGITIGSIAAAMATDLTTKAMVHWLALSVFLILTFALQWIGIKSSFWSKVQDSEPVVLMQNGKILEHNLKKVRITKNELMAQLRQKNIFSPLEVGLALLEPDGSVSVLPESPYLPVQKKDLHIPYHIARLTTEVVNDGKIIEQNLKQRNKNKQWLLDNIQKAEVDISQIAFAAILPNDTLYIDTFADDVGDENNVSDFQGPY